MPPRRAGGGCAAAALALGVALGIPHPAIADTAGSATFGATRAIQTFTVPAGVKALVADLFGAQGGSATGPTRVGTVPGGDGGETAATVATTPGSALRVTVGGKGFNDGGPGGFNGGGAGGLIVIVVLPHNLFGGGGGGGGATDVRTGSGLNTRIVVAAGGAGRASARERRPPAVPEEGSAGPTAPR